MFYPYPTDFPMAEGSALLDYARGKGGSLSQATHAGWVVLGFALSKALPHQPVIGDVALESLDAAALADQLEAELAPQGPLAWIKIAMLVLEILRKLR